MESLDDKKSSTVNDIQIDSTIETPEKKKAL